MAKKKRLLFKRKPTAPWPKVGPLNLSDSQFHVLVILSGRDVMAGFHKPWTDRHGVEWYALEESQCRSSQALIRHGLAVFDGQKSSNAHAYSITEKGRAYVSDHLEAWRNYVHN